MQNRSAYVVALTAALGLFMAVLDNTIVNVALTHMAATYHVALSSIEWVVTGYFLSQATVIAGAGYLSNRFGIKRLYLLCLGLFVTGSLLCGLAPNENWLIAFRVFQGLGGGALFPLAQAIAFQAFPPARRPAASAVVSIPVLLAPIFGPTIGGALTDTIGWPAIFFVNVPVGLLAIGLGWRLFPADKPRTGRQPGFDFVGLGLSILGVLSVVYGVTLVGQVQPGTESIANPLGTPYGWGYPLVWELIAGGVVLLIAFAVYELRVSKDPVLDLRVYKEYNFRIASMVGWFNAVVVFGSLLLIPIFLQQVRLPHLSALDTGLVLAPSGIASILAVQLSSRLYNRIGVRWVVVPGVLLLAISSWGFSQLTPNEDPWSMVPWLFVRGFGFSLTFVPVQTLALQAITGPGLAKASSLWNVTRQIFSSIGVAVLTTLFVQQSTQHGHELQAQALQHLPAGAPFDPTSPAALALFAQAGTQATNDVFLFAAIGTLVMLLLALGLPGRAGTQQITTDAVARGSARPAAAAE
jgi:EmrB/QacA subfamily drug resistance transporter